MNKFFYFLAFLSILIAGKVYSQNKASELTREDKIRIAEAKKISDEYGDLIWDGLNSAPFAILLISENYEYLFYHPKPSEDFKSLGYDTVTGGEIFERTRQYSKNMLATFPAVNGIPTIVVGQPELTGLSSMDWIITVLHEHFHQYQYSQLDYYTSVNSLDLSGGDESGMWMLNYAFPYSDQKISRQYYVLTQTAKNTFYSFDRDEFNDNLNKYLSERETFRSMLSEKDYSYFSFQLWQEGLARYTEIRFAEMLKNKYQPSEELLEINDIIMPIPFYEKSVENLMKKADNQILASDERVCFYTLGALEGLILDGVSPGWHELYFKEKFYPEKYFNLH